MQVRACLHYDSFFKQAETLFTTCEQRAGGLPQRLLELARREVRGSDTDWTGGTLERCARPMWHAARVALCRISVFCLSPIARARESHAKWHHNSLICAATIHCGLRREIQCEVARLPELRDDETVSRSAFLAALFRASTQGHPNAEAAIELAQFTEGRQAAAEACGTAAEAALFGDLGGA